MEQVVYPRPVAGFRRVVQVSHPVFRLFSPVADPLTLLSTDVSLNDSGNPNYAKYIQSAQYGLTVGTGPYQKTVHTAGTREVTWNIGGEVTAATLGLLNLLRGRARGVNFDKLLISQGTPNSLGEHSFFFDNENGVSLPWNSFSLSGNQNAGLTFSLEGKATVDPSPLPVTPAPVVVSAPVPTWTTGNQYVLSWSLSHNVNLQPHWFNLPYFSPDGRYIGGGMLPAYYRALDSEFTLQITTAVALPYYTLIRIGFGWINFVELVVTTENIAFGDRNGPITYEVSSTNAGMRYQPSNAFYYSVPLPTGEYTAPLPLDAYTDCVDIVLNGVPDAGYG
jgi:hypothetical protein